LIKKFDDYKNIKKLILAQYYSIVYTSMTTVG